MKIKQIVIHILSEDPIVVRCFYTFLRYYHHRSMYIFLPEWETSTPNSLL